MMCRRFGAGLRDDLIARAKVVLNINKHQAKIFEIVRVSYLMANAKAVVLQGASVSLLGQPFLENVDEIVIRKGEMTLRDQKDS